MMMGDMILINITRQLVDGRIILTITGEASLEIYQVDKHNKYRSYHKSGNFHVKIIHVLNVHIDLFSWVYGTHKNILT